MKIPLPERGDYYRGLLVLIRQDRMISNREKEAMIRIGQKLDFDQRFCESAINDLLKNPHIKNKAVAFSDKRIAESFLRDAIMLALIDGDIHPKEQSWLNAVAAANGLKKDWLEAEIRHIQTNKSNPPAAAN